MKVLTAEQMREMDRLTVEECGIPYPTLMETAGARVIEAMVARHASLEATRFLIFCGKGNNGGDGAVIARLLWMKRALSVDVYLLGTVEEMKGEARTNMEIVRRLASRSGEARRIRLTEVVDSDGAFPVDGGGAIVVDAIFGTGLTRAVEGLAGRAIEAIAALRRGGATVVAVDIPSGLSSDTPVPIGPHVQADLTVSFTAPKVGNVLPPAAEANGRLVIASIGTPDWLLAERSGATLELVEEDWIRQWLRASRRVATAHKGSVGDVLLIAGSKGKTGAAALAAETVLRAGAGLVTVATAASAQALLVTQAGTEVMTEALAETPAGAISARALDEALRLAGNRTVLALGPGISSKEEDAREFVRQVVSRRTAPMVIDADGLNALAPWPADLRGDDERPIVITPHPGEMARLAGKTTAGVLADRLSAALKLAQRQHLIVVLKGYRTLIAEPGGKVYINPTGNPGMATAGSGDVLTGLLAGLLAQRPAPAIEAVLAGVYLHGLAGDLAAADLGQRFLIASNIRDYLRDAFLRVGGDEEKGCPAPIARL